VTITIIVINVLVFLGQVATSGALTAQGMLFPAAAWSQPWRLVTAGFMHGSVVHLALNMYALWVVGSLVEQVLGRSRMAVAYMASVLGGHVMVLVWFRLFEYSYAGAVHAVIGASGGVFGLFAATLVLSRRLGGDVRGISMVIGLNLVISLVVAQISWQGHVGGLLAGAAAAAAYAYAPAAKRQLVAWLVGGGAAALTCGAVLATVSPWVNIWQF
jgi:membrane associated rhomboid family serine protease